MDGIVEFFNLLKKINNIDIHVMNEISYDHNYSGLK